MAEANLKFFRITVTGARTFILDNTDSTGWGTFTGTASVALTMPSMSVPMFITKITNANPAVVITSGAHKLTNGEKIFLADAGTIKLDGIFTVENVTANSLQLKGVDSTTLGKYSDGGTVIPYLDPEMAEKGIYYENAVDSDTTNCQISGVRYGIYANPKTSGWDGKHIRNHFYNYNENGELLAAINAGGDNTIESVQVDGPVRFAFQFAGPRNHVMGSRLNYSGGLALYHDYASFMRLEDGASAMVIGGGAKGESAHCILQEISGNAAQYFRYGFATIYVSHTGNSQRGKALDKTADAGR